MSSDPPAVDLTNCDREPIHILGHIQPHGLLLACQPRQEQLHIVQLAGDTTTLLGHAPDALLADGGTPLAALLDAPSWEALRHRVFIEPNLDANQYPAPLSICLQGDQCRQHFDGIVHASGDLVVLELEPQPETACGPGGLSIPVQQALHALHTAPDVDALQQRMAQVIKEVAGFDRVMVYRFDADWHGEVVAEEREPWMAPFMGLHYPASDIPKQARALYTTNPIRLIADVAAAPAPLTPPQHPVTGAPLDLSQSVLRSVSPIHIQYLMNMGVTASMSVSLVVQGTLWGLIACHNESGPNFVPYATRQACVLLGAVGSLALSDLHHKALRDASQDADLQLHAMESRLHAATTLHEPLFGAPHGQALLELVGAEGVALVQDGDVHTYGRTPEVAEIRHLAQWCWSTQGETFATRALPEAYPRAQAWKESGAGCLWVSISAASPHGLLWFKPEVIQTVHWAGDPSKSVSPAPGKHISGLTPRTSFHAWKQTVQSTALPWSPAAQEAAKRLRVLLIEVELARAEQALMAYRREIDAKNAEMEQFTYAVSHDLKSPLITIMGFAGLLEEDAQAKDLSMLRHHVERISNAATKMKRLLDELLELSRVGRLENPHEHIDMDALAQDVLALVEGRLQQHRIQVRLEPLPPAWGDAPRVMEVLQNFVDNAAKALAGHNAPEISIFSRHTPEHTIYCVQDNGIGIDPRFLDKIFNVFEKLDPGTEGTGMGLALAHRIVAKHGGRVWAESDGLGKGATFCFSLQPSPGPRNP